MFRLLIELFENSKYKNSTRDYYDQEFDGYGYMKRVYGIEHMPDEKTVMKLSITDTLTDTYSRMVFEYFTQEEIEISKRYNSNLSLLMISIDFFKNINRKYGYIAGDSLLSEIAKIIKQFTRSTDMIFRWAGDEFVIVAPHTDIGGITSVGKKLKEYVNNHHFKDMENISISYVSMQYINTELEILIHDLEELMLQAKIDRK